jgi:monoamine oxidase
MDFTRRTLLIGAGSGLTLLVATACTDETPRPTPTPTRSSPVPPPTRILRSSWASDPYSLGATSYLPVGAVPELRGFGAEPLLDRVFFAGEWRSDAPSTLRGAMRSGRDAADEVDAVASSGERIAVVGAGLAGANAAAILALRGYDVIVIEARDRVGGRIDSRSIDGIDTELGAHVLDARLDEDIIRELGDLGIEVLPITPTGFRTADGAEQDYPESPTPPAALATAALVEASTWATAQPADLDLATALDESGAAEGLGEIEGLDGAAVLEQQLRVLATRTGADASELSAWFLSDADATMVPDADDEPDADGETPTGPVRADGALVTLVDGMLAERDVLLSTAVVATDYSDDGVSLRLATGESLSVDRVVVAVPLGVLQAGAIEFDPVLPPSRRAALNTLGVGDVEVVVARFEEPFWSTDAQQWNVVGADLPIVTWLNMAAITGEPELVGIVGGSAAAELAELNDGALADAVRQSLAPFVD